MTRVIYILLLFPIVVLGVNDSINETDTLEYTTVNYWYANEFAKADSIHYNSVETNLKGFQNYLPFNHLGNGGLPLVNLIHNSNTESRSILATDYAVNNYHDYFLRPDNIKYYNARSPYSSIFYGTGSKNEQIFQGTLTHNVLKNWNLSADFNRVRSDGFYGRQNTNDNFVNISTNFKSSNNRYYLLATFLYNGIKHAENGGLITDTTFTSTGTYLTLADRIQHHKKGLVKQYLNIGSKSIDSTNLGYISPSSRFILTSEYENNKSIYKDETAGAGFYSTIYEDSVNSYDGILFEKLSNELLWKRVDNNQHRGANDMFGLQLSGQHQLLSIEQNSIDTILNHVTVGAGIYNTYSNSNLWWKVNYKQSVGDYNTGDYVASASIEKGLKDSTDNTITLEMMQKAQSPDFIYNRYESNHFRWENNFSATQTASVGVKLKVPSAQFVLGADYSEIKNVLYFDTLGSPQQYGNTIELLHGYIKKDFTVYKFHLDNMVQYQLLPTSSVIRLPELSLEHALYFESPMFKKALRMQIGASVNYQSSYYANAYMPATGQFYLQNNILIGDYPAINVFLNVHIKRVRLFVKIDHLNDGWMGGEDYLLSPNYFMNGRAVKFGLSWRFYD